MPQRTVFQDILTRRFISAEAALEGDAIRSVYDSGKLVEQQLLSDGQVVEDFLSRPEPNWQPEGSKWGMRWDAGDGSLNLTALQYADAPNGATRYKMVYRVQGVPGYERGYETSDWLDVDEWPPDLSASKTRAASGIARIFFDIP